MASIISASTTSGTALNMSADTTGVLQFATGATPTTAVTIDTSQRAAFVAGTAALPAITTAGDTNTGMFFPAADTIAFAEGGTEAMRLDSSGNVLINTTSSSQSFKGLKINSDGATGNFIYFGITGTGSYNNIAFFRGTDGSLSEVGKISTTGSATSYVTSSDYRLKENILPMTGALDKVLQLKPCTYTWKSDNSNGQGFIAHELADIVPDAVVGEKDAVDAEGNIKPQGVDTSFLVATLTAAIQEQQTIINDLKARIETLESK